jgi:hypothetical protein
MVTWTRVTGIIGLLVGLRALVLGLLGYHPTTVFIAAGAILAVLGGASEVYFLRFRRSPKSQQASAAGAQGQRS